MPELEFDPTRPDTKWNAVNDVLIVQQFRPGKKGLIQLPETSKLKHNTGEVLSVGAKVECGVKPGDVVVWQVFTGQAVGLFDEERWAVREKDVLAVMAK